MTLIITLGSCTAYRHNVKPGKDEGLQRKSLEHLDVDDRVRIQLKTGRSFSGRVVSIDEEYMVVHVNRHPDQTIYYQQITRIKYDVNQPVTAVKVIGGIVGTAALLWLLFPPSYGSFGFSF